jgi:HAD superfamily hydrolase (TIGR01509 family)
MTFKALIWDCDGCLIDSEHIACELGARLLTEAGYKISTEDYIRRFCGQGKSHIFKSVKDDCGVDYREHMQAIDKKALQREAFRANLKIIDGIHEVLEQIDLPMAIASGSDYDRLEYTLQLTGLYDRFKNSLYSSSLVAKGKPSPDIFLYAAEQLGVDPRDCLVVEDSINGVRAGKAANMTVFGFTGGSHVLNKQAHRSELLALGADLVFDDMRELPRLIKNFDMNYLLAAVK